MLCVFLQSTRRESFSLDLEMVSLTFSKISFCTRQLSKFRGLRRRSPSLDTAVRHAQYVFNEAGEKLWRHFSRSTLRSQSDFFEYTVNDFWALSIATVRN